MYIFSSHFACAVSGLVYAFPMPRGKRTVFTISCTDCKARIGTVRLHKQNAKGVAWKDFSPEKFCGKCRKRVGVKLKEERHSK